ncbi:MAG: cytochrome c-type biogenesis protein CcmH [Alphaproteobacteria bacterium]|nr:cytochrome c-type biogenesis protein CcmH [Alphaproteobacteria bacterium]
MRACFLFLLLMVLSFSAAAVEPGEMLKDPVLEARAREISKNLRCLVCQGEAIDDSNSDFAKDLRVLVRTRLAAGDTDDAVVNFLRDRYGDFILLKPPVENKTLLLWLTPFLVLGAGLCAAFAIIRRKP